MLKRQLPSFQSKGQFYTYNIMLGSACNWHCPYCIQSARQYKQADPNVFCDALLEHLEKTQRLDKINTFCLWGGEPLIYYDTVKILLERLSTVKVRDYIRISSNGSLLTESNYDLFNKYDTKFEVSYHDGQLPIDKWKIALKIKRITVSSLISHKVTDWAFYHDKWQELCQCTGRYVKWYIFPMIYAGSASSEYALTVSDIDCYVDSLYRHLDELDNVFYRTAFEGLIYDSSAKGLDKYENYCFNDQSIAIDLYGNRYACHHDYLDELHVGNIFKSIPIKYQVPTHEVCKRCEAYKICVGGCFRCKDRLSQCYYYRKIHKLLTDMKQYKACFNYEIQNLLQNV